MNFTIHLYIKLVMPALIVNIRTLTCIQNHWNHTTCILQFVYVYFFLTVEMLHKTNSLHDRHILPALYLCLLMSKEALKRNYGLLCLSLSFYVVICRVTGWLIEGKKGQDRIGCCGCSHFLEGQCLLHLMKQVLVGTSHVSSQRCQPSSVTQ